MKKCDVKYCRGMAIKTKTGTHWTGLGYKADLCKKHYGQYSSLKGQLKK